MDQNIIITVDIVLFTLRDEKLQVVLLKREKDPYQGQPALPGGYIHAEEDIDSLAAAWRVLKDKTGLVSPYLEQLYTFSGGARDPRGWSVSIAYYALVSEDVLASQANTMFTLLPVDDLPQLPFDHNRITDFAVNRLRNKSTYSALPCHLLPENFTLTELQQTYEKVLGHKLDKSAFRRKTRELDFLEPVDEVRTGVHRPAQLYRIRPTRNLVLFDRTI
ncbi:MAG: NUDIX hydrolase [Deltaproteobacteria bacterium]|nr:NUDIX hydrolase [Deltaproteobacteria bacterium]